MENNVSTERGTYAINQFLIRNYLNELVRDECERLSSQVRRVLEVTTEEELRTRLQKGFHPICDALGIPKKEWDEYVVESWDEFMEDMGA